jgi:hypothetical protein
MATQKQDQKEEKYRGRGTTIAGRMTMAKIRTKVNPMITIAAPKAAALLQWMRTSNERLQAKAARLLTSRDMRMN